MASTLNSQGSLNKNAKYLKKKKKDSLGLKWKEHIVVLNMTFQKAQNLMVNMSQTPLNTVTTHPRQPPHSPGGVE